LIKAQCPIDLLDEVRIGALTRLRGLPRDAPDTETLMSTTGQNARAERIAPQKDEGRIVPSVKYFTQNGMNGAYKRLGQLDKCLPDRREIFRGALS